MKKSECKFENNPDLEIKSFVGQAKLILTTILCVKNETKLTFPELQTMFEKNVAHIV